MGYMKDTSIEIKVVASGLGRGQYAGRQLPKTRVWLLETRQAVVITPAADGRSVQRETYDIESATHLVRDEKMIINMSTPGSDSPATPLVLDMKGCGCGFGVVANAAPMDVPHRLMTVRSPDWYEEK